MKILVLSDSHSSLRFMRRCIEWAKPQAVIHLGDYYDDGKTMAEEYPGIDFYQVPGNCDRHRYGILDSEIRVVELGGARLYLTHGHLHGVKSGYWSLIKAAQAAGAQAALFGHTHNAWCSNEDGLWLVNPGSCGYNGGSAAMIVAENGKILGCRLVRESEIEDFS